MSHRRLTRNHMLCLVSASFQTIQSTYVFASCGTMFHVGMSILFSLYISIHRESQADTMFG